MPTVTTSDGRTLHYVESGSGPAILLIHGFAADLDRNWRGTGWFDFLVRSGWKVIAFDQRGHGGSEKIYDPLAYSAARLVLDVLEVLDATNEERAVVMGYSMGAAVALDVGIHHPARCRGLVLGGMGRNFFPALGGSDRDFDVVATVLEAEDPSCFPDAVRAYRTFAQQSGGDLKALAACWRRPRRQASLPELRSVQVPALIVIGDRDEVAGPGEPLAEALPAAALVVLRGKDHLKAVGAREHRTAVGHFLAELCV